MMVVIRVEEVRSELISQLNSVLSATSFAAFCAANTTDFSPNLAGSSRLPYSLLILLGFLAGFCRREVLRTAIAAAPSQILKWVITMNSTASLYLDREESLEISKCWACNSRNILVLANL